MFKQFLILIVVGIIITQSTIQVYEPQCAAQRLPKPLEYTLSNFGYIPYGHTILGQIVLPKNAQLCTLQNQVNIKPQNSAIKSILLVKRGLCKFTQKVINAQKLKADMVIIYDNQKGSSVHVVMKNDGHGHLAEIPSIFISNADGLSLNDTSKCGLPLLKIQFEIQQREKSDVILWLDAHNRQSYSLVSQFYYFGLYNFIKDYINLSVRFRVQTSCNSLFCSSQDCYGSILGSKFCRTTDRQLKGTYIIDQQLRQHFLWQNVKNNNDLKIKWWNYMSQFDRRICIEEKDIKDCSYDTMRSIGVSEDIIKAVQKSVSQTIANANKNQASILKDNSRQAQELSIFFYPQATINNKNYFGLFRTFQVFQMICQSLIKPPKQCNQILHQQVITNVDETSGKWKTILITLLIMTVGFVIALLVYTKIIRSEVDSQLSIQVNKMVENYVDLGNSKKSVGNSYSKFEEQK